MNEQTRPGGLTALAVINLVFAGLGVLQVLGMIALFAVMRMAPENVPPESREVFEAMQEQRGIFIVIFAVGIVESVLLLLSGIGYLKLKRVLGRMLGNVYAVIAIATAVFSGLYFSSELGGGFNLGTIISLVYPLLTLVLINTTFKDDLTN